MSLTVQEDRDAFTFIVGVADTSSPTEQAWSDGGQVSVDFTHHDQAFRLNIERCFFCIPADYVWSSLYSRPVDSEDWSQVWIRSGPDGPIQDEENDVFIQRVPRSDLRDASGAKPFLGRSLSDAVATSMAAVSGVYFSLTEDPARVDFPVIIGDRMPDSGTGAPIPVQVGLAQTGSARLSTDRPMRASNGEATTFIYSITATNVGDKTELFELEAMGAPSTWSVLLPVSAVELDAGQSRDIPVLVSTPFRHLHGAEQTFHVHMTSANDRSSVGRLEIGVIFNEIPQPAGHHSQIWFHSRASEDLFQTTLGQVFPGNDGAVYMNAREDDENDARVAISGLNWGTSFDPEPVGQSRWFLDLDPGLLMGLDFDMDRLGSVVAPIKAGAGLTGAQLQGRLVLLGAPSEDENFNNFPYGDRTLTVLANLTTDAPVDVSAGAVHEFTATLTPQPEADYIPYDPANNMVLELRLSMRQARTFTTADAPYLEPGGSAVLPLLEYHDPVDDVFDSLDGPILRAAGAQQRLLNPGSTAIFDVEVENARDQGATYKLSLSGARSEWASVVGSGRLKMTPEGTASIQVAVQVPGDARDGDLVDLVLSAEDQQDPTIRGLIRLFVEVDTEAEHDDDGAAPAADVVKDAPGLSVATLVVLAGALVALRRRR